MKFYEVLVQYEGEWVETISISTVSLYEGWNFNSGNYLFTTDTK